MVSLGDILDEAWRASLEVSHVLFMSWFLVTKYVQLMKFNSAVHLWFVHFSVHILPNIYFWKWEFYLKIWITFQDVSLSEKCKMWEFPVVQWLGLGSFTAEDLGSIPGQGTKIPQATLLGRKKKKPRYKRGWTVTLIMSTAFPPKIKNRITTWPSNSTSLGAYPKELKARY